MNKNLSLFKLSMVVLITTLFCTSILSKSYGEVNLEKDLKKLINSNKVNASDTTLMTKYIVYAKSNNEILADRTYSYIPDKGKELKQKASMDLHSLRTIFESDKRSINVGSVIINSPPPYFYNDTIKYFYVLLLINGIQKEDKLAVNTIIQRLKSIFPETIDMASHLVLDRKSFKPSGSYYEDDVADKKIMWFAFHGKKNKISFLTPVEKEVFRRNGWKVVEVP